MPVTPPTLANPSTTGPISTPTTSTPPPTRLTDEQFAAARAAIAATVRATTLWVVGANDPRN